jgi:hypothetical protein
MNNEVLTQLLLENLAEPLTAFAPPSPLSVIAVNYFVSARADVLLPPTQPFDEFAFQFVAEPQCAGIDEPEAASDADLHGERDPRLRR